MGRGPPAQEAHGLTQEGGSHHHHVPAGGQLHHPVGVLHRPDVEDVLHLLPFAAQGLGSAERQAPVEARDMRHSDACSGAAGAQTPTLPPRGLPPHPLAPEGPAKSSTHALPVASSSLLYSILKLSLKTAVLFLTSTATTCREAGRGVGGDALQGPSAAHLHLSPLPRDSSHPPWQANTHLHLGQDLDVVCAEELLWAQSDLVRVGVHGLKAEAAGVGRTARGPAEAPHPTPQSEPDDVPC